MGENEEITIYNSQFQKQNQNYWRRDKVINTHTLTKRKKGGMAYGKDSDV